MDKTKIRVIIVDDHQMMRETWTMVLSQDKHIDVIAQFGSAAEVIHCAPLLMPDVVLMDINMSPVNGIEATKEVLKQCPQINIIGISVNNRPSYARNMVKAGGKGFVTKNSSLQEMIEAIITVHKGNIYLCREIKELMNGKGI